MATVLNLPTHILQPHRISYGFSVMIQKHFVRVFQLFPQRSNISLRKTLERICKSYQFSENDLTPEMSLAMNLLRKETKLPIARTSLFIYSYSLLKKVGLIVIGSCNQGGQVAGISPAWPVFYCKFGSGRYFLNSCQQPVF